MYKNLREIAPHKKRLWSRVVVLQKNIFSLQGTVFNSRKELFQSTVFLYFTRVFAAIQPQYGSFSKSTFSHELRTRNVFDICFTDIFSNEHLEPYIWVIPSLLQEAICFDLIPSRLLCLLEARLAVIPFVSKVLSYFAFSLAAINSINCSVSTIKEQLQPRFLSDLLFFRTKLVVRRNYSYHLW